MALLTAPLPSGQKAKLNTDDANEIDVYIRLWELEYARQNAEAQRWTMFLAIAAATGLLAWFKKW